LGLAIEIGSLFTSLGRVPIVQGTESDDLLVNQPVQLQQISGAGFQDHELEKLKCEESLGMSHLEVGGGDARQLAEENVNPCEESKRFMCETSLGPSHVDGGDGDTHKPRYPNHWLIGYQLEIHRRESELEVERREQKEHLWDLEHYLSQEWRFATVVHQVQHMDPGRTRDKAVEWLWISVYAAQE
jgi:hypothetical protein